ncbi:hypothetical protein HHK36_002848 [Tetracentron sinense]|uniref:LysM domain-containing protein n=1 Tax=Tetracentron sinense TaxID=13715 RepID=A0A834ZN87_TETSI|nr:hypothetical protein HHK36_002848 [Tetracentron sinense]
MRFATLLLTISFLAVLAITARAQDEIQRFNCSSSRTCDALIDYVSPNTTTLNSIKTLFGVKNLRSLLGANSMALSTSPNKTVASGSTIKIPFQCNCTNGTGKSNRLPVYKVQKGDGLDHIARDVFAGLLKYQRIVEVNNITNPDLIEVGQELWIPLPCSCDDVDTEQVVHYAHVVPPGSSIEQIADKYGTTKDTLLKLNGITDPSKLQAGEVLDVPLKACTSMVRTDSLDYPLLISNGTYSFTANNCVQCKCDSANNWTLQCGPSEGVKISNWDKCPSMQCNGTGNLHIGNTTSSTDCGSTTCAYAGYTNQAILTILSNQSTCPGKCTLQHTSA